VKKIEKLLDSPLPDHSILLYKRNFIFNFYLWGLGLRESGGHSILLFLRNRVLSSEKGKLGNHPILMKNSTLMKKYPTS
jgi:hypothetical protein